MENHGLLQTERERTGNRGTTGKHLPVAQWIVHAPPKREIQVRLLAGGPQDFRQFPVLPGFPSVGWLGRPTFKMRLPAVSCILCPHSARSRSRIAYIRKLSKDRWRAQVERAGVRRSAIRETKRAAEDWAAREQAALLDVTRGVYPVQTLRDAMTKYAREVSPTKRRERNESNRLTAFCRDFPQIAGPQLAVDAKVEESQFPGSLRHL